MTTQPLPTILIVDDMPENVGALFHFLGANDFDLLVARDGESALQIAEQESPNLILLDVMMPGMDGFETCQRLKAHKITKNIPVIFMTALVEINDKIKGFKLGAVDYITKPFQQEEILARLHTHLTIHQLQQELQVKNAELEAKNEELNAFSHTVAHDLKSPLNHLIGLTDFLSEVHGHHLNEQGQQCLQLILQSAEKSIGIINALLLLAGISRQRFDLSPLDMNQIMAQVEQHLTPMIKQYQGKVQYPAQWPTALGYMQWVEQIWLNYLSNGLKYGGQPPYLELGATLEGDMICFWIRDNGPGLSHEAQAKLFTPFTRLDARGQEEGHGLGLSIVQRIVEKLGGKAGVKSQEGEGSTFYFTLPAVQSEHIKDLLHQEETNR